VLYPLISSSKTAITFMGEQPRQKWSGVSESSQRLRGESGGTAAGAVHDVFSGQRDRRPGLPAGRELFEARTMMSIALIAVWSAAIIFSMPRIVAVEVSTVFSTDFMAKIASRSTAV